MSPERITSLKAFGQGPMGSPVYQHLAVQMCGDLVAGVLLSIIICMVNTSKGETPGVCESSRSWALIKSVEDWQSYFYLPPKVYRYVLQLLADMGLIEVHEYQESFFVLLLNEDKILQTLNAYLEKKESTND